MHTPSSSKSMGALLHIAAPGTSALISVTEKSARSQSSTHLNSDIGTHEAKLYEMSLKNSNMGPSITTKAKAKMFGQTPDEGVNYTNCGSGESSNASVQKMNPMKGKHKQDNTTVSSPTSGNQASELSGEAREACDTSLYNPSLRDLIADANSASSKSPKSSFTSQQGFTFAPCYARSVNSEMEFPGESPWPARYGDYRVSSQAASILFDSPGFQDQAPIPVMDRQFSRCSMPSSSVDEDNITQSTAASADQGFLAASEPQPKKQLNPSNSTLR